MINGKIDDAKQMLGRKFSIEGPVVKGDGKGREIGFPTANIDTKNLILPPNGVYASYTKFNGKTHKALLNIGVRPTIIKPNPSIQVEAHILKFDEKSLSKNKIIVFGNLPYNISTEILSTWIINLKNDYWFSDLILMFQKEVADRIIAIILSATSF